MTTGEPAEKTSFTSKQWLLLLGCGLGFALTGADPAVFSSNISAVRSDLGLSGSQTAFIASFATLVLAAAILGAGLLGDVLGKKRMFVTGALVTLVGEIGVAASPNFATLIVFRGMVGIGFAFLLGLSLTLVNSSFPAEQRPRAMGMYLAMSFAATAPMPAIAGVVAANTSWRWGFVVFAAFAALTAFIAFVYISEVPRARGRRFDVVGIVLAAVTLVGLVYGISKLQDGLNAVSLVPLLVAAVAGAAFVVWERRVEQPAIDLRLFTRGPFNAGVAAGATFNFMTGGFTLLISYYLVVVQGTSTAALGLIFLPAAVVQAFAANYAGRSIARRGNRTTISLGLGALVVTCLIFASLGAAAPLWLVLVAFVFLSTGNALTQTPEANLMMSYAPRELGGSIAGVKSGLGQATYSLGPVVFTLLGSVYLRAVGSDDLDESGYTVEEVRQAVNSTQSHSSGSASGGGQLLDPDEAAEITEALREPFAQALQLTSLTIMLVPVAALLLTRFLLPRGARGAGEQEGAGSGGSGRP